MTSITWNADDPTTLLYVHALILLLTLLRKRLELLLPSAELLFSRDKRFLQIGIITTLIRMSDTRSKLFDSAGIFNPPEADKPS
jgi:hypothetical protein